MREDSPELIFKKWMIWEREFVAASSYKMALRSNFSKDWIAENQSCLALKHKRSFCIEKQIKMDSDGMGRRGVRGRRRGMMFLGRVLGFDLV